MADQGLWWKLWCSALDDPDLDNLDLADFGRYCKAGAFVKRHGQGGEIVLAPPARALCATMQVSDFDALLAAFSRLPNVRVRRLDTKCFTGVSTETNATVTFENWQRYQGDYSTLRVRKKRGHETAMKRLKRRREEKRGEEKRREETITLPPSGFEGVAWGTPEDLVTLYNTEAPDNVAAVEVLSPKRRDKIRRALRQFADESWWKEVFAQYRRSRFLRGLTKPTEGHASFRPDFDWLLSTGKNGVENYVRVHDGMYAD